MTPAGRRRGKGTSKLKSAKTRTKKRSALQGGGKRQVVVPQFYRSLKFMRFFHPQQIPFLRLRKIKRERLEEAELESTEEGLEGWAGEELRMAPPARIRGEKRTRKSTSTKTRRNISKKRPVQEEVWRLGMIRYSIMACQKSPEQDICYICGDDDDHEHEHFCPYNYIYGRYFPDTCTGECALGEHRITSRGDSKFLRCFIRVGNLPPGFSEWDLEDLFSPFGPLLMWDVPKFKSKIRCCGTEIPMSFGYAVFKKREDGERAINELNGYEVVGHKLRVDWVYPSCV